MKPNLSMAELEVCRTEDDSVTVLHRTLDAHYRSTHGANAESKWVFYDGTLLNTQPEWRVIELGFGLGTNLQTLLLERSKQSSPSSLHYIGLDHQPIPSALLNKLYLEHPAFQHIVQHLLLQIEKGASRAIWHDKDITIELWAQDITTATLPSAWANAVFHDPFGPSTNPESWTPVVFQQLANAMQPTGILSTYGAAGHARRAMVAAGLWTASTQGFGRKREMTIASPSVDSLQHGTLIKKYVPNQP